MELDWCEGEIFEDGKIVDEIEMLEYHADFSADFADVFVGDGSILKVDLPEPEGPIMTTFSPAWSSKSMPRKTLLLLKDFLRFLTLMIVFIEPRFFGNVFLWV